MELFAQLLQPFKGVETVPEYVVNLLYFLLFHKHLNTQDTIWP